jgi:hypothetical protein
VSARTWGFKSPLAHPMPGHVVRMRAGGSTLPTH